MKATQKLINSILALSNEPKLFKEAVKEWSIYDVKEDSSLQESCICGHEGLYYLFTIKNDLNNNKLYPIGSICIKKFGRTDLYNEAKIMEQLFKLYHVMKQNDFMALCNTNLLSRNLLRYLYLNDAFKATPYNNYDAYKDYEFMLKMFNKGFNRTTSSQDKKVGAILLSSVRPFLEKKIGRKVFKK